MVATLRQIVTVEPGGVVRVQSDQLRDGAQAEVVLISESASNAPASMPPSTWKEFVGVAANSGRSVEEIDKSIRELRDEWPE